MRQAGHQIIYMFMKLTPRCAIITQRWQASDAKKTEALPDDEHRKNRANNQLEYFFKYVRRV
jgi:hypothetical protein